MQLGDIANAGAVPNGKPLDGIRVLAAEQMQALPFATQLLARLGAEVVKVEHPVDGESGRGALPAMNDPEGRRVGATFLRNNLNKRSVGLDLKSDAGRELFLELAGKFDIVAENFKAGTMDRLGLGYDAIAARHPKVIYASVSGFGERGDSPYRAWPAYAMVPEAMSGLYEYARRGDEPPRVVPAGALGDISSALFAVIGILAAIRHRDTTGKGQQIDIAMLDSMIAMTDVITNFQSLGAVDNTPQGIMTGFRAGDGWFAVQVVREHQFVKLAELVGAPEWIDDPAFATRAGWAEQLEGQVRPAVERWARDLTRIDACAQLGRAGIPSGPCFTPDEVIHDDHVARRNMLVEMPRVDGVERPVLIPGNPVKLSAMAEGPETRVPWVGEHTAEVLNQELGLDADQLERLRQANVIN
ncbi:MAG TPA: CaiB/BaiF CoA-transferase family protein [Microthrixaceae bacterium]|nr:CaiB/BaiF CoA-transferase family protein [Microthrixaceae bacterium]